MMIADRDKVRIILVNLLSNAGKFTKNGMITLSAKRTQITEQSWIIFEVADTGIGIAPEKQSQIFQPFLQGDNSFTKEYEGLGLGLAINQRYCELMGGRIEFESTLGEGSTFFVTLPAEITAVSSMFVRASSSADPRMSN
jgi:signal transduction histidine kinase